MRSSTVNILFWSIIAAALLLRLYRISANEFVFYDEGMYLGQNRHLLDLVAANPPRSLSEFFAIMSLMFKAALGTPKVLWFMLLNARAFIMSPENWYFARIISLLAGVGALGLTYAFAKRYFQCQSKALLAVAILALLPSHVFYSRLGMQESLSALLFLAGMYVYVFSPRGFSGKLFLAGILLSAVYFTNYRMIVTPAFAVLAQFLLDRQEKRPLDWQKALGLCAIFGLMVIGIGLLHNGANLYVTSSWMLHQAEEAHGHRSLVNFLSYPYYLFTMDHVFFGILFFSNIWFWWRHKGQGMLPFALAAFQMLLFSFAAEKGARYLCVVLPFAAMAAAHAFMAYWEHFAHARKVLIAALIILFAGMLWRDIELARSRTQYGDAVAMVLAHDPQAKIISSQPLVESLFMPDENRVVPLPKDPAQLAAMVKEGGYRYLIIDPQVYISWTADEYRFSPPLLPFLEELRSKMRPVAVLPHLQGAMLRRFVLDHNQDLPLSVKFLNGPPENGSIYIYDLGL